jgi:CIC family chloride channel protein
LFLGAMLGGAIGSGAQHFFPGYVATPGAYALVGMGAAFAGIVRAPMTSVVMIFEITRDYAVIVPLMISNLVSYFIASRIQKEPIYELLAEQDGIHLPVESQRRGRQRQVSQVMHPTSETLSAEEPLARALERVRQSPEQAWLVCDHQALVGLLTRAQLETAGSEIAPAKLVGDLLAPGEFPHLHADHTLDLALDRMGALHVDLLPVVSRANIHEVLGVVKLADVLQAYGLGKNEGN